MYFDEKGPLIFSASVHFAVIVFFLIKSMLQPEKKPEEMIFELYSPPAASAPNPSTQVTYTPTEMDLPTIDEIDIPEPEPPPIPDESEPEPVEPPPEEAPPERVTTSFEEFRKNNPVFQRTIPKPRPTQTRTTDLSSQVQKLQEQLSRVDVSLSETAIIDMSPTDQNALESYFAQLRQAILSNVKIHPLLGTPLRTEIEFKLAPTGFISDVRVIGPSGDVEYDRKVVDGVKRLRNFTPPPGFTGTETLTFAVAQRDR